MSFLLLLLYNLLHVVLSFQCFILFGFFFCDLVIATSVIQRISSHLIRMDLRNESHSCHPTCDTTELVRSCANFDIVNGNTVMGMGLGNVVKANPVPTLYPYNSVCKSLTFSFKSLL